MFTVAVGGVTVALVAAMLVLTGMAIRRDGDRLYGLAAVFTAIAAVATALSQIHA